MSEWTAILDDLTTHLRWRQERQERTEEIDPETLKSFLSVASGKPAAGPASTRDTARSPAMAQPVPAGADPVISEGSPAAPPVDTPDIRLAALAVIAQKVAACRQCVLCEKRKQPMPGQGNALSPDILFVADAPGAEEDEQGVALAGEAGQLLTKMIAAMGYAREEVYITSLCKCCPPGSRHPDSHEMQACIPYLRSQIAAIRPRVIVALGATAVKGLLDSSAGISRLRGTWTSFAGLPLMPTYHPTYLLRLPSTKKDAWEDLKKVLAKLGRPVPAKKG